MQDAIASKFKVVYQLLEVLRNQEWLILTDRMREIHDLAKMEEQYRILNSGPP